MKTNISIASDYCVAKVGSLEFYYGYEETRCPKHKDEDECYEKGCDDRLWCFVVRQKGKEIYRSDLGMAFGQGQTEVTAEYVLEGILEMIAKKKLGLNI